MYRVLAYFMHLEDTGIISDGFQLRASLKNRRSIVLGYLLEGKSVFHLILCFMILGRFYVRKCHKVGIYVNRNGFCWFSYII